MGCLAIVGISIVGKYWIVSDIEYICFTVILSILLYGIIEVLLKNAAITSILNGMKKRICKTENK